MLQSHFYTSQKFFLRYVFEVLFFTGSRKKCKKRNKVAAGIRQPWCKNKNEKSWRRSMACSVMLSQGSSMESRCGVVTKQQGGAHLLVPNPVNTATRTSLWHFTVVPSLKPQLLRDTAVQLSPLDVIWHHNSRHLASSTISTPSPLGPSFTPPELRRAMSIERQCTHFHREKATRMLEMRTVRNSPKNKTSRITTTEE